MSTAFPKHGLYAITPRQMSDAALLMAVEQVLEGGLAVLQFRDKHRTPEFRLSMAKSLRTMCTRFGVPLIINDDAELAKTVAADGVHLGRDDGSVEAARALLGPDAIIGVSCYDDLNRAIEAEQAGANYVAFGRFFPSKTKPDARQAAIAILREAKARLNIPIVAIGGITPENGADLIAAGADLLACVEGVFGEPDIEHAANTLNRLRATA